MSDGSGKGFLCSATLHGAAAALLFFSFVMKRDDSDRVPTFELVAGEGDNYMAREAPALGSSDGVKVNVPKAPEPKPTPPAPTPEISTPPPQPKPEAPKTVAPVVPPDPTTPNFKKQLVQKVIKAESQAKRDIKKQRDAEKKRQEEEAKKEKQLTKEEFDKANANKTKTVASATKSNPTKVQKIDSEGIAKGVIGGSTANKVGGAGGKALKTDNTDVLAGYDALFKQRLRAEFEPPPGLSDSLKVDIEVRSSADGTLSGGRVVKSSGSAEFDRAVLDALRRVRMPARPDKKSETVEFTFTMREREG